MPIRYKGTSLIGNSPPPQVRRTVLGKGLLPELFLMSEVLMYLDRDRAGPPAPSLAGDTTPCRMTGMTLHSHVHYTEI
jgi:hypothetical protein